MRRSFVFVLPLLACGASAQKETTNILIGGKSVGQAVWEQKDDGSFKSDMSLSVQGITIESHSTGVIKDGVLKECTIEESVGPNSGKGVWKDDKLTAWQGDKEVLKDKVLGLAGKPFFASYHLQLWSTIWHALEKQQGNNEVEVVNLSSFTTIKLKFERRDSTIQLASGPKNVTVLKTDAGGVGLEVAFDEKGNALGMNVPSQMAQFIIEGYEGVFVDPLSKYPELSQPTHNVKSMTRVKAPMRDGIKLMSEVALPEEEGKYPTILVRTPYGRKASMLTTEWFAKRGYAVVVQDVRGRGGSEGEWNPLVHEKQDGKDTLDWIAAQPWSDGKVGMIGGSYLGYVQWAAASNQHPSLRCIIPQVSPPPPDRNFPWDNGAFMLLTNLWWLRVVYERDANTLGMFQTLTNLDALKTTPITKVDDEFFGKDVWYFDAWTKRNTLKDWGDVFTLEDVAKVNIPVLHVSGVWDGDGVGTMLHWDALRKSGGDQRVVFGPWTHIFNTSTKMGKNDYGPDSVLELDSTYLRFFDTYLKDRPVSLDKSPRVKFFVTGANKWLESSEWPTLDASRVTYFLGGGKASGKKPLGELVNQIGTGKDSYVYDPNKVSFDQKELEIDPSGGSTEIPDSSFGDGTLYYRTAPLTEPTIFAGPATIELFVSTSAKDATFHVMLLDEDEKGVRQLVGMQGTARATYQDGVIQPLVPGKGYKVTIEPWWFARKFERGHRLALFVFSDMFPQFARNPGTGEPEWKATKYVRATHSVWKDKSHPSKVTLWKIPTSSLK